jgi:enediyne biosynthesis protein E4
MSPIARIASGLAGLLLVVGAVALLIIMRSSTPTPTEALAAPHFVDDTAVSGVDHTYEGDWHYFEGGGVAAFDCNADAMPDLYFAGGENPAALFMNVGEAGGPLAFEAIATPTLELDSVTGAYPVDIDSDGITDLVVLRIGENVVMRGLGDCAFERANEQWGIDGGSESTFGFSATWEAGMDLPTLAFGNYLKANYLAETDGNDLCSPNVVLRPAEGGYSPPIDLLPAHCTLSLLFSDWDRNGTADLRVTNDRQYYREGEEQLWAMGQGTAPSMYTRDEGWNHLQIWGMGIASYDITGDGLPEVYLTSQGDNKLQALTDGSIQPSYSDVAIRKGVTAHKPYVGDDTLPSTAWHPEFQDVNNDGFIDLYVAKGNVDAMPTFTDADPNNLFLGQPDGTFVEGAMDAGIVYFDRTRGAAVIDLNLDGLLDLVEVNRVQNVRLWRNVGGGDDQSPAAMGNWVDVSLEQEGPNPTGIGSWIDVRVGDLVMSREVTVGGGHASGQVGPAHFGIGPADRAEVRVTWPDGQIGEWTLVDAGEHTVLTRTAD